ncbi:7-cyano-7-deazaguanine synthase [Geobacter sp. SVR]|uniref:7-cyano-7-deazaguanine synthase n=1 Tax=Geobacter sp. SVR TaxID=2495594 RepID=UPI001566073F|nr:7-cyano-7-deazaguanine synthase [Geobacter sp. SVR]
MKRAILISGGIDSLALCYWQRPDLALTINYGQFPAVAEIGASAKVCQELQIPHDVVTVDCRHLGSGDLAGTESLGLSPSQEWWPYRNQLLVTLGAMKGIQLGVVELLLGSVKSDSFHADGTANFYAHMNALLNLQEGAMKVSVPAISMTSVELVKASKIPAELLSWAHSCHVSNVACGGCRGCFKHQTVMAELGYGFY